MKMGNSKIRVKFKNSLKVGLLLGVMTYAAPAQAKIIKYCIIAKTADQTDAGISGYPEIAMSGEGSPGKRVYSGWKEIGGDQDRNSTDKLEIDHEDMGVVTRIDVENTSNNAWRLHYIRIYRNTGCSNTAGADGYSEFSINKWFEGEKKSGFTPTDRSQARVTVSKEGRVVINKEEFTVANYASVNGQREQMVMQFKELWSNVDVISMSTSSTNSIGASATLTYESPQTVAGTFGGSASVEWSNETSKASEQSSEKLSASEYDWSFVAPGNTFVIKKATFEIPYSHQLYRSSHNDKAYVVRTVGAQIIPSGDVGSFIEIPQRNNDGSITTIGLDDLQKNWLAYLQPGHADKIKKKSQWVAL